ncbi:MULTISPECIES: MFS transporter [Pontibacillus]|uniref:MFS transporter n=1 Tax=Pontibacillus chungwhensis TaxID=265426 RepID=A0ABY8UU74_9BACI|nr:MULTISPECIES: MFS transporter [Pontibacillus]MCD5323367.1 MFS transporter [Pontibacillus sp. HN14]WIF96748.1 MFS transporter [Pontibacillus chungwhensis]
MNETQASLSPKRWFALAAVCFGLFMALLDVTIVNVALPTIQEEFETGFSDLEWVLNAYTLIFAVALITVARLGDLFGRKKFFMIGLIVFSIGSLLCALAPSILFLNISRGIQGLGASAMMSLSMAIISTTFFGKERGIAFGVWGSVSGLATAIGPLVGGVLVEKINWESIFYINIPIGIIALFMAFFYIKETKDEETAKTIDFWGLLLITSAVFCLVYGLIEVNQPDLGWSSPEILALLAGSLISFIVFILVELRLKVPMVNPRIFKNLSYSGACIAAFSLSAGVYALFFYLTLLLQNYYGYTALETGIRFITISGFALFLGPISGMLTNKVGTKPLISGALAILSIAVFMMTVVSSESETWAALIPAFLMAGIGNGIVNPPISTTAVDTVPNRIVGMASGVNNVSRQIGIAFGTAFLGAILSNQYVNKIETNINALSEIPEEAKQDIIDGVSSAGPIAGSQGLQGAGSEAYQNMPGFSKIQTIAETAFVNSLDQVFITSGVILALGAILSFVFIRRKDFSHNEE